MGNQFNRAAAAALLASLVAGGLAQAAMATTGEGAATASVIINASPQTVWHAVHEERFHDPDLAYAKILAQNGNSQTLEERFQAVPILGSVTAVLAEHEQPYKRIDYSLISSDKFKRMDGSWSLTPVNGGKQTLLKLSSYLDVGVPFSGLFIRNATQRKLDRRVAHVKEVAECEQAHLAETGAQPL